MSFTVLSADEIVRTLRALEARIAARFPGSGLSRVCAELVAIGAVTRREAEAIAAPNRPLQAMVALGVVGAIALLAHVISSIEAPVGRPEAFNIAQGIEAAMNIAVLLGTGVFFALTLEARARRRRALKALHVFRSITHVIDMHQLTKDPSVDLGGAHDTPASPPRVLTPFELARYLDYCSEMLSLTGKLAALHGQSLPDPVVIEAVNDIEELTTALSQKIWQKIAILDLRHGAR